MKPSQTFETPEASGFDRVGEEKLVMEANGLCQYFDWDEDSEEGHEVLRSLLRIYEEAIQATHQKYQAYADLHELEDVRVAVEVLRKDTN